MSVVNPAIEAIHGLEFSFYDVDRAEIVRVTGPYRLVAWHADRIDLVASIGSHPGRAKLVVLERNGELWVRVSVVEREYLTRVH